MAIQSEHSYLVLKTHRPLFPQCPSSFDIPLWSFRKNVKEHYHDTTWAGFQVMHEDLSVPFSSTPLIAI